MFERDFSVAWVTLRKRYVKKTWVASVVNMKIVLNITYFSLRLIVKL